MSVEEPAGQRHEGAAPGAQQPREHLTIEVDAAASTVTAIVTGELDEATAPNLIARVTDVVRPGRDVIVDVGGLTFCGSAGLSALLLIEREVSAVASSLTVARPSPFVLQLLEMAGLDRLVAAEG
jgi:anti-anti-sigma factor